MAASDLRAIHILADLTDEQLEELAGFGEMIPFAAGQRIINQGDRADALFMLMEGRVTAIFKGKDGNETPLRTTGAGGHFGEIGLLEEGIRTASVRAETQCRVFRLQKDSFQEILKRPDLAAPLLYNLSRSLALRLADVTNRLADVRSLKDSWLL